MTSKKTTRRALFSSVISLILCFSMLVGTTFAWFTDEVKSGMNVITAGNLDVELYHSDKAVKDEQVGSNTVLFDDVTLWEPGAVAYENFVVANEGNLALEYQLALNFTKATKNDKGRTLADVLKVAVVEGGFNGDRAAAHALTYNYDLSTFALEGKLEANKSSKTYGVVIYWQPSDNDNDFNMKNVAKDENGAAVEPMTIDLGIHLFATQLEHENDSFDNTYDEDASLEMPEVKVETPTVDAFLAALEAGETAVLTDNMTLDDSAVIPADKTSAIDLNGYTLTTNGNHIVVKGGLIVTNGTVETTGSGEYAFGVRSGATLNIEPNATVKASGEEAMGIYMSGGELNVDGNINVSGYNSYGVFLYDGSNWDVNVNGKITATESAYAINQMYGTSNIVAAENALVGPSMLSTGTMNVTYYGDTKPVVNGENLAGNVVNYYNIRNVATEDELIAAIKAGANEIYLAAGSYMMPDGSDFSLRGKTLAISGTREAVIDASGIDERDQFVTGANLTFEGVTLNFGTVNYMGFANAASLTYKDCAINGLQFCYGSGTYSFVDCDLNSNGAEHSVWTWGGQNVSFTGCDFTYSDRAVNCYGEGVTTNVSFADCTFTKVAGKETTGAIETNSSTLTKLNLTINNCSVNEGDLWWVSTWDSKDGANTYTTVNGKVASNASLLAAIKNGATEIELAAGNYNMPDGSDISLNGKTLTIKGTKDTVIDVSNVDERDQFVTGATLKFEGVTLNFGTALYMGFANTASLTYKDCVINGVQHLYGDSITFEGCTLNATGDYMVRTWGGKNVTFNGCTFNCDGKALLVYNQSCNLTVNKCVFNDNGDGTISGKAAIEVCNGDNGANCVTHNIVVTETTVNGFDVNPNGISTGSTLWANKNSLDDDHLNVTVDGTVVY